MEKDEQLESEDWEKFLPADPAFRRLHRGIRLDPESVWEELRSFLCQEATISSELDLEDLIEDLMFWHAEAFVDRIEALTAACPELRIHVVIAHVGGITNPGVDRFDALQERLARELEDEGVIQSD